MDELYILDASYVKQPNIIIFKITMLEGEKSDPQVTLKTKLLLLFLASGTYTIEHPKPPCPK